LIGSGTPTAGGTFMYPLKAGTSTCSFSVMAVTTVIFSGTINGAPTTFNFNAMATSTLPQSLTIIGNVSSSSPESLSLALVNTNGSPIAAGTYNQAGASYTIGASYVDATSKTYVAGTNDNTLNIVITSITPTQVQGTFTGTLKDNNGAGPDVITITSGTFNLPL
jgi:hypothetical protein